MDPSDGDNASKASDVTKALAAFGAPSIRYHSFGQGHVRPSNVVLPRREIAPPLRPAEPLAPLVGQAASRLPQGSGFRRSIDASFTPARLAPMPPPRPAPPAEQPALEGSELRPSALRPRILQTPAAFPPAPAPPRTSAEPMGAGTGQPTSQRLTEIFALLASAPRPLAEGEPGA